MIFIRKKYFLTFALLNFLVYNATAQPKENALKYMDTLCSEQMYGRGYVKNGAKKAADFITYEFKKIGTSAFHNKYQQEFKLNINTFGANQTLNINKKPYKLGVDLILSAESGSSQGKIKVIPLKYFLGKKNKQNYGVYLTTKEYNDLSMNKRFFKYLLNAKMIIRVNDNKLTASLSQHRFPMAFVDVVDIPDKKNLNVEVNINSELKRDYTSQNVISYVEGTQHPDSFLVFCAHYDHLGGMGNIFFPGANDNAAGIAMLFELAKYYVKNPHKYSVAFIAFGGEEAGLIGSKHFVENPLFGLSKTKFVMNVDLMGTGEEGITVVNGKVFESAYDKLVKINKQKQYLSDVKARGKAANSDHYYFSEQGIPSFFIYTRGEPKHYHDIFDNGSDLTLPEFEDIISLLIEFYK